MSRFSKWSFLEGCPTKMMFESPHPCMFHTHTHTHTHTPLISSSLIWLPQQYLIKNVYPDAPGHVISPVFCYLLHLRPKYPPQHPNLEHPQSTFLLQCDGQNGSTHSMNLNCSYSTKWYETQNIHHITHWSFLFGTLISLANISEHTDTYSVTATYDILSHLWLQSCKSGIR
jgi:hypothetical protein